MLLGLREAILKGEIGLRSGFSPAKFFEAFFPKGGEGGGGGGRIK